MPTECFMVEPVHERRWTAMIPEEDRCEDRDCCGCWEPQEQYRCDVRRCDTYEIIATDCSHFPPYAEPLPAGAMFWKTLTAHSGLRPGGYIFAEGPHLHVVLPGGHAWNIDSRASNCSMPDDMEHRCWVRAGDPPMITVGKDGLTCAAGAGSIRCGDYHGFLIDGVLTDD